MGRRKERKLLAEERKRQGEAVPSSYTHTDIEILYKLQYEAPAYLRRVVLLQKDFFVCYMWNTLLNTAHQTYVEGFISHYLPDAMVHCVFTDDKLNDNLVSYFQ